MNKEIKQFIASSLALFALIVSMLLFKEDNFLLIFALIILFIAFPVFIVSLIDLSRYIRKLNSHSRPIKVLNIFLTIPEILFGVISIIIGIMVIIWVLYNSFIERQDTYSGSVYFVGFGLAIPLITFGKYLLRSISHNTDSDESQ